MKKAEAAAQKGNDYPVLTGDLSHTCFTEKANSHGATPPGIGA